MNARPSLQAIIATVAAQAACPPAVLTARRPLSVPLRDARRRAVWACRTLRPDVSFPKLGAVFGCADHTTAFVLYRRSERLREIDQDERQAQDWIVEAAASNLPPIMPLERQIVALLAAVVSGRDMHAAGRLVGLPPHVARWQLARVADACTRAMAPIEMEGDDAPAA